MNRRNDPSYNGAPCVSDYASYPGHLWTWTGGWKSIPPGEERWVCFHCGAMSESRTVNERPCSTCVNPHKTPYCGYICGSDA